MAIWPHDWPHWQEAFWSNWALVIVGGIAGYLAWRTLRKIGIQADVMGRQLSYHEGEMIDLELFSTQARTAYLTNHVNRTLVGDLATKIPEKRGLGIGVFEPA